MDRTEKSKVMYPTCKFPEDEKMFGDDVYDDVCRSVHVNICK